MSAGSGGCKPAPVPPCPTRFIVAVSTQISPRRTKGLRHHLCLDGLNASHATSADEYHLKRRLPSTACASTSGTAATAGAAAADSPTAGPIDGAAFDWQLALALAGCAFEAYNGLEEGEAPHLRQLSPSGASITYVDRDFLTSRLAGVLEVTALSATGLKRSDWWPGASSDPYLRASVGGSTARTPTQLSTLDPRWDHPMHLFVRDLRERLTVRVLDEDVDSDDLLGVGALGLGDLVDGQPREVAVPLGAGAGSASLRLQLLPFDEEVLAAAAGSRMGGPVLGSPARALLSSPWRDLKRLLIPAEAAADAMFDPVAFVENEESDTQAWLFINQEQRVAVVAFRGTESTRWKDVLTDLSMVPCSCDPEGAGLQDVGGIGVAAALKGLDALRQALGGGAPQSSSAGEDEAPAWVHAGFLRAYQSVRAEVLQLVDTAVGSDPQRWAVYVTGHSLGGALSTLCAQELARRTTWRGPAPAVANYSFGSPRVGNAAFAAEFDALVPNTWRVVNTADAVAQVPRLLGYCHVGHRVALAGDGSVAMEWNSSRGAGEGAAFAEVGLAALGGALGGAGGGGASDDVSVLIAAEVAAMSALLDGSAVAEHMEPLYMENLQASAAAHFAGQRQGA